MCLVFMFSPQPPAFANALLTKLAFVVQPVVEVKSFRSIQQSQHPPQQAATDVAASFVAGLDAVLLQHRDRSAVVRDNRVMALVKERCLINPLFAFDDLNQPFPAEANIRRMARGIDEVANFQIANENFAAVTANPAIAPHTFLIRLDLITKSLPKAMVAILRRMNPDDRICDAKIGQDRVPQFHGRFVIVAAE